MVPAVVDAAAAAATGEVGAEAAEETPSQNPSGHDIHNYARGCREPGISRATPHIHYTLTTVPMNNLRWWVTVSSIFNISPLDLKALLIGLKQ